ncbi:MAG TPA: hypothetical protein PLF42_05050 [Anaerolineales bacterium]|nr:hypothetical protein [Anaerolineales bacterium]
MNSLLDINVNRVFQGRGGGAASVWQYSRKEFLLDKLEHLFYI